MFSIKYFTVIFLINLTIIKSELYFTKIDNVTVFDPPSFINTFNNKPIDNWIIQFYHSYCGHCINFAPIFKIFLNEAKHWTKFTRFGVVDCSVHKGLCTDQEVRYFPFFKFYYGRKYNNSSSIGEKIDFAHSEISQVFSGIITQIENKLKPSELIERKINDTISEKIYFLVKGKDSVILKRIILTFTDQLLYPIFYRQEKNPEYEVEFFNGTSSVSHRSQNMNGLHGWLIQYINSSYVTKVFTPKQTQTKPSIFRPNKNTSAIVPPVYNQDIYASIYYSFTNDISDNILTTIDNVVILNNFVEKLYLYSDLNEDFTEHFKQLLKLLHQKIESLRSRSKFVMKWSDMLRLSKLPKIEPSWVGCNGSEPHLRRYPCGLWTMLHTLTINHHIKVISGEMKNDDSLSLIRSARDFIITFFACRECAENFKMETQSYKSQILDSSKAVIFLWKVHNSVNKRLSGAPSEDPYFPKQAFPSQLACPTCRLKPNLIWPRFSEWSYPDVLNFLILHYSNINRIQYLTKPVLLIRTSSWFIIGPSSLDISICVLLSVFCSVIVILTFIKFWLNSKLCHLRKPRKNQLIT